MRTKLLLVCLLVVLVMMMVYTHNLDRAVQRLVSVREQYHSNMIGLHVDSGNWLTSEHTRILTGGLFSGSPGLEDAQGRAALMRGGQVKLEAYTLAYSDGYIAIAFVAALAITLIALMKPVKIYFNAASADETNS
jgi:DHA2 family multidrug resistance protein